MINEVILLVEDNPDFEALAITALTKCTITNRVVVARDGAEALSVLFGEGGTARRLLAPAERQPGNKIPNRNDPRCT